MCKSIRYLYLFILSLTNVQMNNAQDSWAPLGATWYYSKQESIEPPNIGYLKIECISDTLINEQSMKVLSIVHFSSEGDTINFGNRFTYLRNDTVFQHSLGHDYILYSYADKLNSDWIVYNSSFNVCGLDSLGSVKVDSVGIISINGFQLKFIVTSPNQNSIWQYRGRILERIGCLDYMFPVPIFCDEFDVLDFAGPLRCYYDPELGLYQVNKKVECDSLQNWLMGNTLNELSQISVSPNPTNGILKIKLPHRNFDEKFLLQLHNLDGRILFEELLFNDTQNLNIYWLEPGIYLLTIMNPKSIKIYSEPILKF